MKVDAGLFQIMMSEERLNGAQIGASFQEVGCKTVAQRVRMDAMLEAGVLCRLLAGLPHYLGGNGMWGGMPTPVWE